MQQKMIYQATETWVGSIISDVVTFGFLLLCIWYSHEKGGGWWTFFTCSLFLLCLSVKCQKATWVKLDSKKAAIEWAQSLPEDATKEAK